MLEINLKLTEGDPFNEILVNKLKQFKSKFFKNVSSEIIEGKDKNSKLLILLLKKSN